MLVEQKSKQTEPEPMSIPRNGCVISTVLHVIQICNGFIQMGIDFEMEIFPAHCCMLNQVVSINRMAQIVNIWLLI